MGQVNRIGNFGIVDTPLGMMSLSVGAFDTGAPGSTYIFSQPSSWYDERMQIGGFDIIPMGFNNDMPNELQRMLDEFYSGEGILGKIQGLQWGEGPRLYKEEYTPECDIIRKYMYDKDVMAWLKSFDYENELLKCHTDLIHGFGFFFKTYLAKGYKIGMPKFIARVEHVQVDKARLEYPGLDKDYPERIIVGNYQRPHINGFYAYPIFNKQNPFKYPISMGYQSVYSFCKSFYSTPRFLGAYSFIKLASTIAPLLANYNANASAISFHIESPQEYWNKAEEALKTNCEKKGIPYEDKMLEDFKDEAFKKFSAKMTGYENVGNFMHTISEYNDVANDFHGWKIVPIDKKIKDYIDAQIAISNKADSASTSGFGLHPSLSNIMVDGKMASGSEMLYALKTYIATETAIPEMILFSPFNAMIEANFPGKDLKLGFYRKIVMKEDEVTPSNRVTQNA